MTPTNEAGHGLPELPDSVLSDLIDWHKRDGTKKGVFTTQALQELAAHRESLALSRGVPAGMVLVPKVPAEAISLDRDLDVLPPWPALPEPWTTASVTYAEDGETCTQRVWTEKQLRAFGKACAQAALDAAAPAAAGAQVEGEHVQAQTKKRGENPWKDAVLDALANTAMDAPVETEPSAIVAMVIAWHEMISTNPPDAPAMRITIIQKGDAQAIREWHNDADLPAGTYSLFTTPQPAAADGGVRERARAAWEDFVGCHLGDDEGEASLQTSGLCRMAFDAGMRASSEPSIEDAIVALVSALQRGKGWMRDYADAIVRDAIDRRGLDEQALTQQRALSSHRQAGDHLSKFRELAERWRGPFAFDGHDGEDWDRGARETLLNCADELLALVEKGAGNGR